jgi:hypothetical protein
MNFKKIEAYTYQKISGVDYLMNFKARLVKL